MWRVIDLLPLENLTYLSMCSRTLKLGFPANESPPAKLFSAHTVRHLAIELTSCNGFTKLLSQTCMVDANTTGSLFPRLEVLTLRWNPAMSRAGADLAVFKEALSEMNIAISARRQCSTPMREVQIDRRYEALHAWELTEGTRVVFFEHNSGNHSVHQ
ncbi:hypothetical protein PENSPDRAFT_190576 [Peniophora sp. CONT]|nr:hypothetical protein PENSPDRAFT_190576 [Peniophora sp. CONT]